MKIDVEELNDLFELILFNDGKNSF